MIGTVMEKKRFRPSGSFMLALAAFIWGIAFVAQRKGGDLIGPFTFNGTRFLIGGMVLLPVLKLALNEEKRAYADYQALKTNRRMLLTGGFACGSSLFAASNLQQLGITFGTSAGKAGFLTACYIVFVPLAGLFLGKKVKLKVWAAVAITLAGLYLLCLSETFFFSKSDLLVLASALCFTVQILAIDHFVRFINPIALSVTEFIICGLLTMIPAMLFEIIPDPLGTLDNFSDINSWIPLLYVGLLSTGVSYTLQIVGQKSVHPTIASLLMSLESVFAVLAGWAIMGETLTLREGIGCVLIFAAIILAQL